LRNEINFQQIVANDWFNLRYKEKKLNFKTVKAEADVPAIIVIVCLLFYMQSQKNNNNVLLSSSFSNTQIQTENKLHQFASESTHNSLCEL